MRIMNLKQDGDDWLLWRRGGLGATTAPILLGLCPPDWEQSRYRLWEELTGRRKREPANVAMQRGRDLEPLCRQFYEARTGTRMPAACVVHDKHDWLRASLDGLNIKAGLLLEIKCTNKDVHQLCLDGEIIDYYHAQIQHQLLVTGLREGHYLTFNNLSFQGEQQYAGPLRVLRDNDFLRRYFEVAKAFWQCVVDDTPPQDSGFFGWLKCGRERKWRRVTEAATEQECSHLLHEIAAATGEAHTKLYVGEVSVNPNIRERVSV